MAESQVNFLQTIIYIYKSWQEQDDHGMFNLLFITEWSCELFLQENFSFFFYFLPALFVNMIQIRYWNSFFLKAIKWGVFSPHRFFFFLNKTISERKNLQKMFSENAPQEIQINIFIFYINGLTFFNFN